MPGQTGILFVVHSRSGIEGLCVLLQFTSLAYGPDCLSLELSFARIVFSPEIKKVIGPGYKKPFRF
jgi:hypothetical protein